MQDYFRSIVYSIVAVILIGLVPCPVLGQVPIKKQLTEGDY